MGVPLILLLTVGHEDQYAFETALVKFSLANISYMELNNIDGRLYEPFWLLNPTKQNIHNVHAVPYYGSEVG